MIMMSLSNIKGDIFVFFFECQHLLIRRDDMFEDLN